MVTIILVCWIIAIICVVGMVWGYLASIGELWGLMFLLLFADIIFGFGMMANAGAWCGEKTDILVPEEVAKSQYTLFVKCKGETLSSSDVKIFTAPESSIRVQSTQSFNAYSNVISIRKEIIIDTEKKNDKL